MTSPSQPYKLFVLENPLLDIQAHAPQLLEKYNLKANDAILASPEHLGLYADLLSADAKTIAGGAAQNTARGVQYLLPRGTTLYVGAVGADDYANTLKNVCKDAGLDTEYMIVPDVATGRCGVIISGKDRSLCTDLGAANHYKIDHLKKPNIWAHAQAASYYYVGGYHLTVAPDAAEALGQEAAEKGKTYVLNLSAPFIPVAFAEPLKKIIAYTDILIGNETEAGMWAQSQGWSEDKQKDIVGIAKAIAGLHKEGRPGRTVIITQGTDPTLVVQGGEVKEYPVHSIGQEKIVDTNGAGDAFAGGFMAGLVEGKDVKTCVDMGQWLARLSIQELGPS